MKDFDPSPRFVSRVMRAVRTEAGGGASRTPRPFAALSATLRWSVALGGALVTAANLFRILAPFFVPSLCG